MTFYGFLGSALAWIFFGSMIVFFVIIPIAVLINLLSIPNPKVDDREWQDFFNLPEEQT